MSANAHTAVMTDLEQRIQDGRQLSAPRPRIDRIMEDRFYGRKPRVDIQRAVLFTQSMMQTEAYPQVLRTALAIQYMMEHIEVVIQPHELIVGTAGGPGRYCVLYPETRGGQFPRDLPKILKAEGKAGYAMTQAEVDTVLNEVVPYWKGKTSHELYLNMLPRETRRVIYGDEEYATQGLIFDEANNAHTLSWTGSYEKVIREGLESIIRELEEKKAGIEGNLLHNQMDKIYYLDAAILSCKAMITYAHRYADRAEAMAAEESDPVRRAELETIAEICRHVPEHPARNFYEAVQAQWFLQVGYRLENMNGGGVGLGRLDQYLYPLYKAGLEDRVNVLRLGADDFIPKPFDNAEVLARVEAQLRRYKQFSGGGGSAVLTHGDLTLDREGVTVTAAGKPVTVTAREFDILTLLMEHPKKVFTREQLYEQVWGGEYMGDDNTVNVHISNLRAKLAKASPAEYIKTVWGIGFKMSDL